VAEEVARCSISPADSVALAVRKLGEHRIGALVVENQWMKLIGIFSERDFVNAIARTARPRWGSTSGT
jgi:CBS domain-containing protein